MARTLLTPQTLVNLYAGAPAADSLDFTLAAGDNSNGNHVVGVDKQLLIVFNSDVGNGTFTIQGAADACGRDTDLGPYTLGASQYAAVWIPMNGYVQTDGKIQIDCSASTMKFAVLRLP